MSDEEEEHDEDETEEEAREREEEKERELDEYRESKARHATVGSLWYPCHDETALILFIDAFPVGGGGWARCLCLAGGEESFADDGEIFDVSLEDFDVLEEFDIDFHGQVRISP